MKGEIEAFQHNKIEVIKSQIAQNKAPGKEESRKEEGRAIGSKSYAQVAFGNGSRRITASWNQHREITKLEDLRRNETKYCNSGDLTDIYVYANWVEKIGVIRTTIIKDVFKGRDDMVLN